MRSKKLINRQEVKIRFNEVDSMGVLWHGHYIKLFEDGREAFGEEFGLEYLEMFRQGYLTPIVKVDCDYKSSISYGESVIVESEFILTPAAKIIFNYRIYRQSDNVLAATGSSTQVFITPEKELFFTSPDFYEAWKQKHDLT